MTLTPGEQRLVRAIVNGATNREAADRLRIREQTVKNRLSLVYRKIGVRNRVELAVYASGHLRDVLDAL